MTETIAYIIDRAWAPAIICLICSGKAKETLLWILKDKNSYQRIALMFMTILVFGFLGMLFSFINLGVQFNAFGSSELYTASAPYLLKMIAFIILAHFMFKGGEMLLKKKNCW